MSVAYLYVATERYFYFWDLSVYSGQCFQLADEMRHSPINGILAIFHSIKNEYNLLYCIPLLPLIFLFGASRIVFILSVIAVYQLPFSLMVGRITEKLINSTGAWVFWGAAFFSILYPVALIPALRGYPDIGGLGLVCVALLLFIDESAMEKWWKYVAMGSLLALAVLFRRHFAYCAMAFYFAVVAESIMEIALRFRQNQPKLLSFFLYRAKRIGVSLFFFFLMIFTFGYSFIVQILTNNYSVLYSSFRYSFEILSKYYSFYYGLLFLAIAACGIIASLNQASFDKKGIRFIAFFGIISVIQWFGAVRQASLQHSLHFTLFVLLGVLLFFMVAAPKLKRFYRIPLALFTGALLVLSGVNCLGSKVLIQSKAISIFFPSRHAPLVRQDYDEIVRLVKYLRENCSAQEELFVADSSLTINSGLLWSAEEDIYGKSNHKLRLVETPHIDSRDFYPLEALLNAKLVVVSTPFQHHISEGEQRVVQFVHDTFFLKGPLAEDFALLPLTFHLENNCATQVFRRVRKTPLARALSAFRVMERYTGRRPGRQPDWILITRPFESTVSKNSNATYSCWTHVGFWGGSPIAPSLLYLGSMPSQGTITFRVNYADSRCAGASITLHAYDQWEELHLLGNKDLPPTNSVQLVSIPFRLVRGTNNLVLSISSFCSSRSIDYCSISLNEISIK
jgi:hypothetical protein